MKKVGLLKREPAPAKKNSSSQTVAGTANSAPIKDGNARPSTIVKEPSLIQRYTKRALGGVLTLLLVALIIVPKPKLVTYNVSGQPVQSVYWDLDMKELGGRLLDADYRAYLNEERKELSLCSMYDTTQSDMACSTYEFDSVAGSIPALHYLFTHPTMIRW